MEWVPLTDYDNGMDLMDRPRRLTQEEIAYIVAHVPTPPSADSTAAEITRQGIVEWMIETLKEANIAPSAIPELIKRIVDQHQRSLVVPGTPVGITAAEAVGATTTQMTLNSVAPWERILIQDATGAPHLIKIGEWIDDLMQKNPDKIKLIPENRTQYLELPSPVTIASPDENGKVTWEKVTAVTKHLPVGDLVKVTTRSGREVTATQSKSLLIWDGKKLVQTEGKAAKVGDRMPVFARIRDPPIMIDKKDDVSLTFRNGILFGKHLCGEKRDERFDSWIDAEGNISNDLLFAAYDFARGIYYGFHLNIQGLNKTTLEYYRYFEARIGGGIYKVEDLANDVMLDPIKTIELVPATEFVYDLTVPTTKNFSLWNGLGCADTFHTSGSAKSASFGIEAMRDLIFARKNPKNESCTIYFTNKRATYEEILDSRRYIVGSVVEDFILREGTAMKYDIDSPQVLTRYWWHDVAPILLEKQIPASTKVLRLFLNVTEMYKHKVTISELAAALEREIPPSAVAVYGPIGDGIIDLYPQPGLITDTLRGREKGAIPSELAELTYLESVVIPELKNIRVKGISGIRQLYPVVSPVWRMVILERKLSERDLVNNDLLTILGPYIGSGWLLFYNPDVMTMTGLTPENLAALCQLAGLTIVGGHTDRLIVGLPNDRFRNPNGEVVIKVDDRKYRKLDNNAILEFEGVTYRKVAEGTVRETPTGWTEEVSDKVFEPVIPVDIRQINGVYFRRIPEGNLLRLEGLPYELITNPAIKITEMKPSEYVQTRVTTDKATRRAEIKRLTDEVILAARELPEEQRRAMIRRPVNVPRTRLMEASEFVIAETDGSNLKELLALPGIDKTRTTCNNMYTIAETLGAENARSFLIRALNNTIANTGSYVHPANITFIAEFIMSRGEPYGATYTGISRQPGGHLSLATLERAGKVFTQNALHGRKEDIRNVSASVAVGTRMAIGSGFFDIGQDITENGVPKTVINDDLFTALERDDVTMELATRTVLPEYLPMEDTTGGIEGLKTITVGGTFDYTERETETNLLATFNPGEFIPENTITRQPEPEINRKVVRRVQAIKPGTPRQDINVPRELVDVLNQIKIGVPLPGETDEISITALEQGIVEQIQVVEQPPQQIISTGLIPLEVLMPKIPEIIEIVPEELGIPTELDDLLTQYQDIIGGSEVTNVQELPRIEIPRLPDLTGMNPGRDLIDLRREQIRELQPLDTKDLQTGLKK